MPIPKVLSTGVLPPFLKDNPLRPELSSPYRATAVELVERYGTSERRLLILQGFLSYRSELRRIGFSNGFQWIDGSFVETLKREPNDLDVVTVSSIPASLAPGYEPLFSPREAKRRFMCDAYFVNFAPGMHFEALAEAVYWSGLFSHQRNQQRKGFLQIELMTPDSDASAWERLQALRGGA